MKGLADRMQPLTRFLVLHMQASNQVGRQTLSIFFFFWFVLCCLPACFLSLSSPLFSCLHVRLPDGIHDGSTTRTKFPPFDHLTATKRSMERR